MLVPVTLNQGWLFNSLFASTATRARVWIGCFGLNSRAKGCVTYCRARRIPARLIPIRFLFLLLGFWVLF
ncbi:hypothetical protein B0J17DRAFT_345885 [Rhizoctonia solani]|nr:hypothetical protein B0J17DRAFT_345885 [Rhizoctonia solani]